MTNTADDERHIFNEEVEHESETPHASQVTTCVGARSANKMKLNRRLEVKEPVIMANDAIDFSNPIKRIDASSLEDSVCVVVN